MVTTEAPRYSVIVPVYNAAGTIEGCLEALLNQSVPGERYEVVVVDDGSVDRTAELVSRFPVRLLRQRHGGPASARNRGAEAAIGRLLLFTDADCVPIATWVEEITRPLEAGYQVAGVKGVYRTRQASLVARFAQLEFEQKYAHLRRQREIDFVDTGSAAFRADAFWQAGGFDPTFQVASNEDTDLSYRLVARGWRLVFAERAAVYHRHAQSLRRYLLRKRRHGYWRVRVYRRHPEKMLGDSYTPPSTRFQLAGAWLAVMAAALPRLRVFVLAGTLLFALGTLPFLRRAAQQGWDLTVIVPGVLFLRALALGTGLAQGALAQLVQCRMRRDAPTADRRG